MRTEAERRLTEVLIEAHRLIRDVEGTEEFSADLKRLRAAVIGHAEAVLAELEPPSPEDIVRGRAS